MEKLEKEEELENQLEELRDYGFNIDQIIDMMNDEDNKENE